MKSDLAAVMSARYLVRTGFSLTWDKVRDPESRIRDQGSRIKRPDKRSWIKDRDDEGGCDQPLQPGLGTSPGDTLQVQVTSLVHCRLAALKNRR